MVRISADKVRKATAIVKSCRGQNISFYYGQCLYFAYWADYIAAVPEAAPDAPSVLCPSYAGEAGKGIPGTTELMKQAIDLVMSTIPVDGLAFESFHHGRCRCSRCIARFADTPRGTAEFHAFANLPIFAHVRERYPKVKILFCAEGPLEVIQRTENLDILEWTLRAIDAFVWCGAAQPPAVMNRLARAAPRTELLMRQEPWQSVPPVASDRDGWFFPNLLNPLGRTIHERAAQFRWAGVAGCGLGKDNPCDNINLRFLARMQMDPSRDPRDTLESILREIYQPHSQEALTKLVSVFEEPENRFRALWPRWFMHIDFMPKGYKFTAAQTAELVKSYQAALAVLREVRPELGKTDAAGRLETSLVKWIDYIEAELRKQ
jgi:hypothetical protein